MEDCKTKKESNGWIRGIIIGIITVVLSVGGSIYTSGETVGQQKEKISQLEAKVAKMEDNYSVDHDLLLTINAKLTNIETILKEMKAGK